ncbi:hypothetical protein [Pelorhabdus rhamnosifermentans]|uniref:hypothetical protein n=1 Tax=Pelorhabdus rhamnosifermentans TaxID=2772457 RepID=UPI001C05F815|nr:hypothetical protein [Pelorhabdus rhamnosifermentans]
MNVKIRESIKNITFSVAANMISILFSVLMILVVPKVVGVEGYGFWQLYVFYAALGSWFQLGWVDGVYLRYAGISYNDINRNKMATQFWLLWLFEFFVASFIFCAVGLLWEETDKVYIVGAAFLSNIILTPRSLVLYVLQITNRIKEYAVNTILEKVLFLIFLVAAYSLSKFEFRYIIISDLLAKVLTLMYLMFLCKDLVFTKLESLNSGIKEAYNNIGVGIKLMFANMASILILAIIRWGISQRWDVATFGKVSLTLSISNFLMVFINAVSVVLFPILKRTNETKLPEIYTTLRNCLSVALLGLLSVYYPLKTVLSIWLPKYADSLVYMAVLFPICLFESKVSLLINTYLKSLRQERILLRINSMAVVVSLLFTFVTIYWLHDLNLAVMSIVVVFAFRCVMAEYFLGILLNLDLQQDILLELAMVVGFIGFSWFIDSWWSVVLYLAMYVVYLWIKRDNLCGAVCVIREYVSK